MTHDNDVTNTNGASKEYWEARARRENEAAEFIAYRRRAEERGRCTEERGRKIALTLFLGFFVLFFFLIVLGYF